MTPQGEVQTLSRPFLFEVERGNVPGYSFIHKFGSNSQANTTLQPVAEGGFYQTPTTAQSLEFVSTNAGDARNGAGMHSLTIEGLDANWQRQSVNTLAHATDGTIAVAISGTWTRVFRAYVTGSGSYANATQPSQLGTVTVRNSGGGVTWATLPQVVSGFGSGQSLIGAYTVPAGCTAFILSLSFSSDVSGTKTTDFHFFKRENAQDVSNTYSGIMRIQESFVGTQRTFFEVHATPDSYPANTDIGFMCVASAASKVSAAFELLLVDETL